MQPKTDEEIEIGDVVLDLAQGQTMQVVAKYDGDVSDYRNDDGYDLRENYGNARLGSEDSDAVYQCVYCNNLRSEPNQPYPFPESRLARVEVEKAESDLKRPAEEIRSELISEFFVQVIRFQNGEIEDSSLKDVMMRVAGAELTEEAYEVAEIEYQSEKETEL